MGIGVEVMLRLFFNELTAATAKYDMYIMATMEQACHGMIQHN